MKYEYTKMKATKDCQITDTASLSITDLKRGSYSLDKEKHWSTIW